MLQKHRATASVVVLMLLTLLGLLGSASVSAQGCSVSLTMDPVKPPSGYSLGTHVITAATSNCTTVKFQITRYSDGTVWDKAEIGAPNQIETWKTEETGTGDFEYCALGHISNWQNAARDCQTVYVEGNQGAPIGSTVTGNCWVNDSTTTPSAGPIGTTFNFAGRGQCDGNARAARFTLNGVPYGEGSTANISATWTSDRQGEFIVCYQITAGEWSEAAESCVTFQVNAGGSVSNTTVQGAPSTNYEGEVPPVGQSSSGSTSSGEANADPGNNGSNPIVPVQPSSCNAIVPTRLSIGAIGLVSDYDPNPVPLRSQPSRDASILVQVPVREALTMIGNPHCDGEGIIWYETQYAGYTGWMAETTRRGMYNLVPNGMAMPGGGSSSESGPLVLRDINTAPATNSGSSGDASCSGALTPTLSPGDHGRVTYTNGAATAMRTRPQGDKVRDLPEGTEFDVTGAPQCTAAQNGHLWWVPVTTSDRISSGWVPFGYAGGEYWIEPYGESWSSSAVEEEELPRERQFAFTYCYESFVDGCVYGVPPDQATAVFINGLGNTPESFMESTDMVKRHWPNQDFMGIYNDGLTINHGAVESYGAAWATLKDFLLYATDRSVVIVGHSQGGAVTSIALQNMPSGWLVNASRRPTYVFTFGSPAIGYPVGDERVLIYRHCTFSNDLVTTAPTWAGTDLRVIPWSESDNAWEHALEEYLLNISYCE